MESHRHVVNELKPLFIYPYGRQTILSQAVANAYDGECRTRSNRRSCDVICSIVLILVSLGRRRLLNL